VQHAIAGDPPDAVLPSVADLLPALDELDDWIASGQRPGRGMKKVVDKWVDVARCREHTSM